MVARTTAERILWRDVSQRIVQTLLPLFHYKNGFLFYVMCEIKILPVLANVDYFMQRRFHDRVNILYPLFEVLKWGSYVTQLLYIA